MRQKRFTKTTEEMALIQVENMLFERLRNNASTRDQVKYINQKFDRFCVVIKKRYCGTFDTVVEAQNCRDNQPELV